MGHVLTTHQTLVYVAYVDGQETRFTLTRDLPADGKTNDGWELAHAEIMPSPYRVPAEYRNWAREPADGAAVSP